MANIFKTLGFYEYKQEYFDSCVVCSKKLVGRQIKFCSNKCGALYSQSPKTFIENEEKTKRISKLEFQTRTSRDVQIKKSIATIKARILTDRNKKCEICGKKENRHMHHEDYDKQKDVIYVCLECHGLIHKYKNLCKKKGLSE